MDDQNFNICPPVVVTDPDDLDPEKVRRRLERNEIEARVEYLDEQFRNIDEAQHDLAERLRKNRQEFDRIMEIANDALGEEDFFEIFGSYPPDPGPKTDDQAEGNPYETDPPDAYLEQINDAIAENPENCPKCHGIGTIPNPDDRSLMVRAYCPICNEKGWRLPTLGTGFRNREAGEKFAEMIRQAGSRNAELIVEGYRERDSDDLPEIDS